MSQFKPYNPNPARNRVGDCTVRAICKATGKCWDSGQEIPVFYWTKER